MNLVRQIIDELVGIVTDESVTHPDNLSNQDKVNYIKKNINSLDHNCKIMILWATNYVDGSDVLISNEKGTILDMDKCNYNTISMIYDLINIFSFNSSKSSI